MTPKSTAEMTGDQALEVLKWLENRVNYFEHEPANELQAFWPHKCDDLCIYGLSPGCEFDCQQYGNLNLVEYVSTRLQEEKKNGQG